MLGRLKAPHNVAGRPIPTACSAKARPGGAHGDYGERSFCF